MKPMILATGTQSGGTTLVSAAFLKHPELDGILDMASDRIEVNLSAVTTPVTFVKMTTIAFRWQEVASVYEMHGYKPYPLMVVRNPFDVWVSLKKKWYGLNGLTAEDPPLFLRMQRFLEDWKLFMDSGYPVIQFEAFIESPEAQLRAVMGALPVTFDKAMLNPNTDLNSISYVAESNASFIESLNSGASDKVAFKQALITGREAEWITQHFSEYNACYGYENNHKVISEEINELRPFPFDNRRFLGFGSIALARKTSPKYPQMVLSARKHQAEGRKIAIYGACEFGEYLAGVFAENGITVDCFFDSYSTPGSKIGGYQVKERDADNYFIVVASLAHSPDIKAALLADGISKECIFTYGEQN